MKKLILSIIIVNWNGCKILRNCLNSIIKLNKAENYEIIVVDNASSDESVEMLEREFPQVKLIVNEMNYGFAKANNIGINSCFGDIILLLNSDTEIIERGAFQKVVYFLNNNNEIGILGLRLVFSDGSEQSPGGKFLSVWQLVKYQILFLDSPIFYKMRNKLSKKKNDEFYEIDYVSGACLFVKRKVFEEIGLLNEEFFMYGEDMEFCVRAKQKGWGIGILPSVRVVHLKSQSTKKNFEAALTNAIKNNCFLVRKFYGKNKALIAHTIYTFGLLLRLFLAFFRKNESPKSYFKIISNNFKLQYQLLIN